MNTHEHNGTACTSKIYLFGSVLTVNQATLGDEHITLMFKLYICT